MIGIFSIQISLLRQILNRKIVLSLWSSIEFRSVCTAFYRCYRRNIALFALCTLFATSHMLYHGYSFGLKNHAIQIPILKSYFHPELYQNDPMVATRSHFITFNYLFLATIEKVFGHRELLFFSMHWLMRTLFFMAIYQLSLTAFNSQKSAIISMFLMFPSRIVLATLPFIWSANDFLTHTFVVMPFILWAVILLLKERTGRAFALLGLAANINIQTASFVFAMFMLVSILKIRQTGLHQTLKHCGAFILFGAPCLIWAFATVGGPLTDEWIQLLRERSSGHSLPLSWSKSSWVEYLLFFTLGIIAWSLTLKQKDDRKAHITLGWFSLTILLLCGIGFVFAEWIPIKIILRIQLFRSTKFLTLFIVLYTSYAISYLWDKDNIHKLLAIVTFLVFFIPSYWEFLVLLPVFYVLVEAKNMYQWTILIAVVSLLIWSYTPHVSFPTSISLDPISVFLGSFLEDKLRMTVVITFLLWLVLSQGILSSWRCKLKVAVVLLLMFGHILPTAYHRFNKPISQRGNWIRMQAWIKENTPQDAIFLTPPHQSGFRVFSERSTVVEWNDGTQQYFDADYAYEWWDRITKVGRNQEQYESLTPSKLIQLGKTYDVAYVVFSARKILPFLQVYQDTDHYIYILP